MKQDPPPKPSREPIGTRAASRRWYQDSQGEYDLADGRKVNLTWLPTDGQHVVITVWDATGVLVTTPPLVRANAAGESERILQQLEA